MTPARAVPRNRFLAKGRNSPSLTGRKRVRAGSNHEDSGHCSGPYPVRGSLCTSRHAVALGSSSGDRRVPAQDNADELGDLELINHSAGSLTSQASHNHLVLQNEVLADGAENLPSWPSGWEQGPTLENG